MKNKRKLIIVSALSLGLVFSACGNDQSKEDKTSNEASQKVEKSNNTTTNESAKTDENDKKDDTYSQVSLSDWNGNWNSMYEYLEEPDI